MNAIRKKRAACCPSCFICLPNLLPQPHIDALASLGVVVGGRPRQRARLIGCSSHSSAASNQIKELTPPTRSHKQLLLCIHVENSRDIQRNVDSFKFFESAVGERVLEKDDTTGRRHTVVLLLTLLKDALYPWIARPGAPLAIFAVSSALVEGQKRLLLAWSSPRVSPTRRA